LCVNSPLFARKDQSLKKLNPELNFEQDLISRMAASRDRANQLYREKKYLEAVSEFANLIDSTAHDSPDLHIFHSNRSACYMQLGRYSEALEDAQTCKALKPGWYKSYSRVGAALLRLGRKSEAVHALEYAQELEPTNSEVRSLLARARGETSAGSVMDVFQGIISKASQFVSTGMNWFAMQPREMQLAIGLGALYVLYRILSRIFWPTPTYYDEYDPEGEVYEPGYGRYGGHGGYGLSWSMWAAIMGAAWKIPPMLPEVFGQYALPFFGLNFTTFMWLLNMFTQGQRFGGGGLGGLFGGRRRARY
jgi:tetratricopeptide (TPR) repeat protein